MTEIKDESEVGKGSAPVTSLLLDALSSSFFFTKRDRPHMLVLQMFLFMSFSQQTAYVQLFQIRVRQVSKWTISVRSCTLLNGEGNGNPLQYSCLENPKDIGA